MKSRKNLFYIGMFALCAIGFAACDDEETYDVYGDSFNRVYIYDNSKAYKIAQTPISTVSNVDFKWPAKCSRKASGTIKATVVVDNSLIAAYNEGKEWLEELKHYLWENYNYLKAYFSGNLPQFPVTMLEGTYLVWVDCSVLKRSSIETVHTLLDKEKLQVNNGSLYGKDGEGFIRINIACPRQVLIDGLNRLKRVLISQLG